MIPSVSASVQRVVPERPGLLDDLARGHLVNYFHPLIHGVRREADFRVRHWMCLSDFGVILIAEPPLGVRVRSATWGTGLRILAGHVIRNI